MRLNSARLYEETGTVTNSFGDVRKGKQSGRLGQAHIDMGYRVHKYQRAATVHVDRKDLGQPVRAAPSLSDSSGNLKNLRSPFSHIAESQIRK
jgi:hypothetical protein